MKIKVKDLPTSGRYLFLHPVVGLFSVEMSHKKTGPEGGTYWDVLVHPQGAGEWRGGACTRMFLTRVCDYMGPDLQEHNVQVVLGKDRAW